MGYFSIVEGRYDSRPFLAIFVSYYTEVIEDNHAWPPSSWNVLSNFASLIQSISQPFLNVALISSPRPALALPSYPVPCR